jgi:hypothetical protein
VSRGYIWIGYFRLLNRILLVPSTSARRKLKCNLTAAVEGSLYVERTALPRMKVPSQDHPSKRYTSWPPRKAWQSHRQIKRSAVSKDHTMNNKFHSSTLQNGLPIGLLGLLGTGLEKTPTGGRPRKPLACLALMACVSRPRGGLRKPPFSAAC